MGDVLFRPLRDPFTMRRDVMPYHLTQGRRESGRNDLLVLRVTLCSRRLIAPLLLSPSSFPSDILFRGHGIFAFSFIQSPSVERNLSDAKLMLG